MKKLYCFDFDGTLTTKDTMFLFLKFYDSVKYRKAFVKHIPLFVLLKLNLTDAEKVKTNFISSVLKGEKKEDLEKRAQDFFEINYQELLRSNALDFIKNINPAQTECLLVTASLDIWTKPFAKKYGMTLLATEALYEANIFTGKFATPNCNGEEKVRRIEAHIAGKKFDKKIAFGDTAGDRPMLEWADEGHFKFFH